MLQDEFIEGLKWLGKKGFVFDLGVDQHGGGKWQLEEAVEMIENAHEGVDEEEKVTFIISEFSSLTFPRMIRLKILQTIYANPTYRCITRRIQSSLHGEQQYSNSANAARRS